MNKTTKKTLSLIIILTCLSGCQALKDGLEGNKKSKSAEEFLVEKKNPLILPPEFKKLPTPGSSPSENLEETDFESLNSSLRIPYLLSASCLKKKNNNTKNTNSSQSSLEEFIIKQIKKD